MTHAHVLFQATRATYLTQEKNSVLGMAWHLLHPLLMTAVLYLVFSNFSLFQGIEHYPLSILAGLIPYSYFSQATTVAGAAIINGRAILLNTTVPPQMLVFQAVAISTLTFVIELALLLILVAFVVPGGLSLSALSLIPIGLGLVLLVLGTSLALSALVVFLTDLTYVWRVAMRLLFFLTPIFYSVEMLDNDLALTVIGLNPIAAFAGAGRQVLLAGEWIGVEALVPILVVPAAVFATGWWVFSRLRDSLPEYV